MCHNDDNSGVGKKIVREVASAIVRIIIIVAIIIVLVLSVMMFLRRKSGAAKEKGIAATSITSATPVSNALHEEVEA